MAERLNVTVSEIDYYYSKLRDNIQRLADDIGSVSQAIAELNNCWRWPGEYRPENTIRNLHQSLSELYELLDRVYQIRTQFECMDNNAVTALSAALDKNSNDIFE